MIKDPMMPNMPRPIDWRSQPMQEVRHYQEGGISVVESERSYDWRKQLDKQEGKFLELAGPTDHLDRDIIDFSQYRKNTICTNLTKREGIDVVADATKTPFKDGTFAAVLISRLRIRDEKRKFPKPADKIDLENAELVAKVAKEASRVLASGGLLVWLHLETEDELKSVEAAGLIPVYQHDSLHEKKGNRHRYQMVFVKET